MIDYKKAREFGTLELLAKQVVEGFITGLHQSPFHGFSVEFAEHRLYNSGESIKHLDWKLLARTDKLFIKRYEEETNLRCHILIDASSSMMYPVNQPYNKLTYSLDSAAALVFLMRKQRDAFGLSLFSDDLEFHAPAKSSLTHQQFILSTLEQILEKKNNNNKNQKTDLAKMLNRLANKIHKRSLVFIFSDFMAIKNPIEFANSIKHLRHHLHEIVVFDVSHNELENNLNLQSKYYNVVDIETGESVKMHPKQIKERYVNERKTRLNQIHNLLKRQKVDLVNADIEAGFDQILMEYIIKRKKNN
ncbi:MAG: DUF58 domain-containing protein [Flavobacteriales bacterium]|nr:DUF58 domain-containing protein [Flavobacteriales bacterium]MDG1440201.1 DUF58 domain-containing protein [Flavobacteriales bacterium]